MEQDRISRVVVPFPTSVGLAAAQALPSHREMSLDDEVELELAPPVE